MGTEFFGCTGKGPTAFNFRRRRNGIVVAFSVEEWGVLGELMAKTLALPELRLALKRFGAGLRRDLIPFAGRFA